MWLWGELFTLIKKVWEFSKKNWLVLLILKLLWWGFLFYLLKKDMT